MKKAALALVILLLAFASAQGAESMKTAIDIVEDFTGEAKILMESRGLGTPSTAAKENAVEELRRIQLTERPGAQRSARVNTVVEAYTGYVVDSVRRSEGALPDIAETAERLEALRADMLEDLRAILASESIEKKEPKPVPSLDLSPHDEPPSPPYDDEEGGILYR